MPVKLGSAYGEVRIGYDGAGIRSALTALGGLTQSLQFVGQTFDRFVIRPLVSLGRDVAQVGGAFESEMAIMGTAADTTADGLLRLQDAAIAVGEDTRLVGISASEAAAAMTNFYKAGLDTEDIFANLNAYMEEGAELGGALRSAIDLAAASDLDLGQASDVVAVAMATFGIEAERATDIANNFVQAADASVAEVGELAAALVSVGPTAAQFGWSLEDANTALAILSERGVRGSEAGTALKSMMTNLMRPTDSVTAALQALNVSLYDQEGRMLRLPDIVTQLQDAFADLTEEEKNHYIQVLAGTYGMRALSTLLAEGVAGWTDMEDAIMGAATAQEVAEARTNTYAGAMESLEGTLETLKIRLFNEVKPALTGLARWGADFVADSAPAITGALSQVVGWLAERLPPAISAAGEFWQTRLLSAMRAVAGFVRGRVLPVLLALGDWLRDKGGKALSFFIALWREHLQPELAATWKTLKETAGPILAELAAWFKEKLPEALAALSTFWNETLLPALHQFGGFVRENMLPILAGLAALVVGIVVPAFISWAAAAISAAVATIAALAPVLLPIMAIAAAVGLLVAAWQNNWGGIRDTLTEVWEQHLQPALQTLWQWLSENVPAAIQTLSAFWNETLLPAIRAVWAFITESLVPALTDAWSWLGEKWGAATQALSELWNGTLLPALQEVWGFIDEYLMPLFAAIVELFEVTLGKALEIGSAVWREVLLPALQEIGTYIGETLQPVLDALGQFWREDLQPVLEALADLLQTRLLTAWTSLMETLREKKDAVLEPLQKAFEAIKKVVKSVTDWIENLTDAIRGVRVPKWLEGHSPPPMADWLDQIAQAAHAVAAVELPQMQVGLSRAVPATVPAWAGAGGAGAYPPAVQIPEGLVRVDRVGDDVDVEVLAWRVAEYLAGR